MTAAGVIRGLNLRPIVEHGNSIRAGQGGDTYFNDDQLGTSFRHEMAAIERFYQDNQEGYQNKRRQIRQSPTGLKIISRTGYDQLLRADLVAPSLARLEGQGNNAGAPMFRYFPPKTNAELRPFREGIFFIVMHSFGSDLMVLGQRNVRSVPIDPLTGHNPRRWVNGIEEFTNPSRNNNKGIHHAVSLRGDLLNSVSWDNQCNHGGGPLAREMQLGVSARSIGIEHEEWFIKREGQRNVNGIIDKGPYSEEQFAIDAFIIKKLEAYTGQSFTRFLGNGEEGVQNVKNKVIGCVNHGTVHGQKGDPGAEFNLEPDFELGVTDIRTHSGTKDRPAAWQQRFDRWWSDVPRGTKISAYARIFDKVTRLRSFDISTEVFDPAIGTGPIAITPPRVTGAHAVAAAQGAARDRISATDRAQRMQQQTRAGLYSSAQNAAAASIDAWAQRTGRLLDTTQRSLRLPVIVSAIGFDFTKGIWVNLTTRNQPSNELFAKLARGEYNESKDSEE